MHKERIIIAGGRDFYDYNVLRKVVKAHLPLECEIVSGGARGADRLGERFANENHLLITRFEADWLGYGKKAGFLRNKAMSEYADGLIAFWNGKSKGTKNMINLAEKRGLKCLVFSYDGQRIK